MHRRAADQSADDSLSRWWLRDHPLRALNFRKGFFDQTGLLWNDQGRLLCSTHQIVHDKE